MRYSIRQQLVVLLLLCSLLPALTVSYFTYKESKATLEKNILSSLEAIAQHEAQLVRSITEKEAGFSPERLERDLGTVRMGKTGRVFLINKSVTPPQEINTLYAKRLLAGETGSGKFSDDRGKLVLAAYAPIPETGWGVIVRQDAGEALADVNTLKNGANVGLALFSLVIILVAFILGDKISRPIMQLAAWSQKLALGRYEKPQEIRAANEIGHLARSFALMNDNILQYMTELQNQYFRLRDSYQQLEKYRFIINSLKFNGVIAVEADKTVTIFNQTAEKILGISSGYVMGKRIGTMTWPDKNSPFADTLHKVLATGEPVLMPKYTYSSKDGLKRILYLATYPVIDASGNKSGAVCLFRDITEQHMLEEDLLRSEKLHLIGDLAAGTAHEIRNPLTSAKGFIQLLDLKTPDKTPEKEYIRIILEEIEQADRIIWEFLLLARPQLPRLADIEINTLLSELGRLIENQALVNDICLDMQLTAGLPPVNIDKEQMKQVFLNIIQNALQAMSAGGNLSIKTGYDPGTGNILVSFRDTGSGIPPENMDKLYQPFFSTKPEGTGLGLTVSYRIVENHGGKVKVTSSPEDGTEFTIILPASAQSAVS